MGMVYCRIRARIRNGIETERKYTGGVEVIKRQTAELAFCFNGTEQNGNITVFMPPTVIQTSTMISCNTPSIGMADITCDWTTLTYTVLQSKLQWQCITD